MGAVVGCFGSVLGVDELELVPTVASFEVVAAHSGRSVVCFAGFGTPPLPFSTRRPFFSDSCSLLKNPHVLSFLVLLLFSPLPPSSFHLKGSFQAGMGGFQRCNWLLLHRCPSQNLGQVEVLRLSPKKKGKENYSHISF